MFLADAIEYQARTQPHAVALIFGRRVMRYGELVVVIRRMAAMLAARGLAQGDTVGVAVRNPPLHLLLLLALTRLGAIAVSVHPLLSKPRRKMVVDEYQVAAIVSDKTEAEVDGVSQVVVDGSWLEPGKGPGGWRRRADVNDLPWRIGLSSGTTGRPKGVLRTQAQTLNLVLLQRTVIDFGPGARFLPKMDMNLTAHLLRILRYLLGGAAIVFPRTTHVLDDIFAAIDRHAVTHMLISPDVASSMTRAMPNLRLRSPGLEHVSVVGGRLSLSLRQAIVEQLTPNVFMNYGTTETGMMAVGSPELLHRHPDSVGRVVPWARAQVVDEQDRPLPAGEAGILRFRSIGAADGYYRNPAASAKTFRDGWVYPGDIARLLPDGALVIDSRVDDVINVGGIKVEPAGIEEALNRHVDVIESAVFGAKNRDDRETLYAAVVLRGALDERALIRYCEEQVGQPAPRRIIAVRELPRNAMGKVVKHELAAAVMTGHAAGRGQEQPAGEV